MLNLMPGVFQQLEPSLLKRLLRVLVKRQATLLWGES